MTTATTRQRPGRPFAWRVMPGGGELRKAEAAEALRWLGRRLAFEDWLEDLRAGDPSTSSAA